MRARYQPLMLELPPYRWPNLRNLGPRPVGARRRSSCARRQDHLRADGRAVVPVRASRRRPPGATGPAIQYSIAGMIGARARSTSSRRSASTGRSRSRSCRDSRRARSRSARSARSIRCRRPATTSPTRSTPMIANALVARRPRSRCSPGTCSRRNACRRSRWCKRETNSWRYPLIMAGYLFALAYARLVRDVQRREVAHGECMSAVLTNSIVVIAIVASACYAVWRLGPRKMRDALRTRFARRCRACSAISTTVRPAAAAMHAAAGCAPTTNEPAARKEHAVVWRKKVTR